MRYLRNSEKEKSRGLWEAVFTEDSKEFLDYYYKEKTKTNRILVQEEEKEIVSMLQRNPFQMAFHGVKTEVDYIVAVATRKDRRGNGLMRQLLMRDLKDAASEKMPFQFLMPAAEAIYTPYGFRPITGKWRKIRPLCEEDGIFERTPSLEEFAELASFVNICLEQESDLFIQRDEAYFARLLSERQSEGGGIRILTDSSGATIGYYSFYPEKDGTMNVTEQILRPDYARKEEKEEEEEAFLMARITNLSAFLRDFIIPSSRLPEVNNPLRLESPALFLDVADTIIPENHGHFVWYFREGRSHLVSLDIDRREAIRRAGDRESPAVKVDIADLGSLLFGYRTLDELVREGLIVGPEKSLDLLREVKPLQHIMIREEV